MLQRQRLLINPSRQDKSKLGGFGRPSFCLDNGEGVVSLAMVWVVAYDFNGS